MPRTNTLAYYSFKKFSDIGRRSGAFPISDAELLPSRRRRDASLRRHQRTVVPVRPAVDRRRRRELPSRLLIENRLADRRLADRRLADRRLADRRLADRRLADRRLVNSDFSTN